MYKFVLNNLKHTSYLLNIAQYNAAMIYKVGNIYTGIQVIVFL